MNDDTVARPVDGQVRPTMEPVAWFRAPYGTLEPNPQFRVTGPHSLEWALPCYTEEQLRLAVAAERERRAVIADQLRTAALVDDWQTFDDLLRELKA